MKLNLQISIGQTRCERLTDPFQGDQKNPDEKGAEAPPDANHAAAPRRGPGWTAFLGAYLAGLLLAGGDQAILNPDQALGIWAGHPAGLTVITRSWGDHMLVFHLVYLAIIVVGSLRKSRFLLWCFLAAMLVNAVGCRGMWYAMEHGR